MKYFIVLFSAFIIVSCSPKPYRQAEKIQTAKMEEVTASIVVNPAPIVIDSSGNAIPSAYIPTVNFGVRKPFYVIIHHTAEDSLAQTIKTFTMESTQVSAHYVIGRDGFLVQMLNDELRAWHAGSSKWGNITDMNSCSIGIELDNNGTEPFAKAQINTLLLLLAKLKKDYNIPTANFIGHGDIAPKRKADPSILFPWDVLAKNGFGLWYDLPDMPPPVNFDEEAALKRIGYDTTDMAAAIVAFKRHFTKTDLFPILSTWDRCVLHHLAKKY